MTFNQWVYRNIYLNSLGWKLTRWLRKDGKCKKCKPGNISYQLHLHHLEYRWHNANKFLRYFLPNMSDRMQTLCPYHHRQAHKKG